MDNLYCVNFIQNSPATILLTKTELDKIKSLFDHNHIDFSNYQFYSLQNDKFGHHHVRCNQFVNNLMIFDGNLIYHFDQDDNYHFLSGHIIDKIDLNTKQTMNADSVVVKFTNLILQDDNYVGDKEESINNCFDLEFGYFQLSASPSNSDVNFTKVWKIKPTNIDYPYLFMNDDNSETIRYDNGIRY